MTLPSLEEQEELLLSCRYGEEDEVRAYVEKFGPESLAEIRDDNGNTVLHMICGNGHKVVLEYVLPLVPPTLLAVPNRSGSTPLHWAALNTHLETVQIMVQFTKGPGAALIDVKNGVGRTPLGEAEMAQWDEGAKWMNSVMDLEGVGKADGVKEEEEEAATDASQVELEVERIIGEVERARIDGKAETGDGDGPSR